MIFSPALARAVVGGRKTQTRRLVKADKPCRYKTGNDYAVQPGRGKEQIGRLQVLEVREERVGDITHQDAKAEGFRNVADFKRCWIELHDSAWLRTMEGDDTYLPDPIVDVRFEQRHAHKLVTVITFTVDFDKPRFMARPTANSGDYTTQRHRAIDELECIDSFTQRRFSQQAGKLAEEQRASFRRDLELERARRNALRADNLSNRSMRHLNGYTERQANRAA